MNHEELMALTQPMRIVRYLEDHKGITQMEAYKIGITRLPARMSDLRELGYNVTYIWEEHENRYGQRSRYKRYFLGKTA